MIIRVSIIFDRESKLMFMDFLNKQFINYQIVKSDFADEAIFDFSSTKNYKISLKYEPKIGYPVLHFNRTNPGSAELYPEEFDVTLDTYSLESVEVIDNK